MKSLGDRMKNYEAITDTSLITRIPIILRLDGKAFHTFAKSFKKPFDEDFMEAMDLTGKKLMEEIQGAEFAYVQSDEISILIVGYHKINSQAWMNGRVQKITSIGASIATAYFNKAIVNWLDEYRPAYFDARVFNIPEDEVANYFLWRARDNHRNSVLSFAQSIFSHKELYKKNITNIHEMLHTAGKNWVTNCTDREKNGCFIYKNDHRGYTFDYTIMPSYELISTRINSNVTFRED